MPLLEPTYLRYVYDGLQNGKLNPNNAANLPTGFIGVYEEGFPANLTVTSREIILQQFGLWALMKDAVSTDLIAGILELEGEDCKKLLMDYSKWFNSESKGKYILYHDRFRLFILQKLSGEEILALNEKIVSFLMGKLDAQIGDEGEYYGLAHLAEHLFYAAQLNQDYPGLHSFVNRESLWDRQIEVSNGYEWSKAAVQLGLKEGARRKLDIDLIRSAVSKIKIWNKEENSASDILNLLNAGDYSAALNRVLKWDMVRQFKLYLLMLHELTIGISREADFKTAACKAVLDAIDQTPKDPSYLNWAEFYPELAVYDYYQELEKLGLDGQILWERGDCNLREVIEKANIIRQGGEFEQEIIYPIYQGINNEEYSEDIDLDIAFEALKNAQDWSDSSRLIKEFFIGFILKNQIKEAYRVLSQISSDREISDISHDISIELIKVGQQEEAIRLASLIPVDYIKDWTFRDLSKELLNRQQLDKAYEVAMLIEDDRGGDERSKAFKLVCIEYWRKGMTEQSMRALAQINKQKEKNLALQELSVESFKQGNREQAYNMANQITEENIKSIAYGKMASHQRNRGDNFFVEVVLDSLGNEGFMPIMEKTYVELINELLNQNRLQEAIRVTDCIEDEYQKSLPLSKISKKLFEGGKHEEALNLAPRISNEYIKSEVLKEMFNELLSRGEGNNAIDFLNNISVSGIKDKAYSKLSLNKFDASQYQEAMHLAEQISDEGWQSKTYKDMCLRLINADRVPEAHRVLELIKIESDKSEVYGNLSFQLFKNGKEEEALAYLDQIEDEAQKAKLLENISIHLYLNKRDREGFEFAKMIRPVVLITVGPFVNIIARLFENNMNDFAYELLDTVDDPEKKDEIIGDVIGNSRLWSNHDISYRLANNIRDVDKRERKLSQLFSKFLRDGQNNFADQIADQIRNTNSINKIYSERSENLIKEGNIDKAIRYANMITNQNIRDRAFVDIIKSLLSQGKEEEAYYIAGQMEKSHNFEAYKAICKVHIDNNEMEKAFLLAKQMSEAGSSWHFHYYMSRSVFHRGKHKEAIKLANLINGGDMRLERFYESGKNLSFPQAHAIFPEIIGEAERKVFIKGMTENMFDKQEGFKYTFPFLYNYSSYTEFLPQFLFKYAINACFFEEEGHQEKLNILGEVLDITALRRVSGR